MENMDKYKTNSTNSTKMGADKLDYKAPMPQKIICPNCLSKPRS